jgi:hypothetical protein
MSFAGVASAAPVTLTFDELPMQPVDGLTFQGVSFDFKVGGIDSTDALYHSGGPGILTYVQDPSLEGNAAGVLTLDFVDCPAASLQFGATLSNFGSFTPGFTVSLFDAALLPVGVFPVSTSSLISFTEAQFSYSGTPIGRAVIDFNEQAALRFAVDNLTYQCVPEPGSMALLAMGVLPFLRRVRQRRTA